MVAVLLLVDELFGVLVRDFGGEHRRGRRGRDVDDVRFALGAHAQVRLDLFFGQTSRERRRALCVSKQNRGLLRHVAQLDELEVGLLLGQLTAATAEGLESRGLLVELAVVEDERSRRGVLLGLVLGEAIGRGRLPSTKQSTIHGARRRRTPRTCSIPEFVCSVSIKLSSLPRSKAQEHDCPRVVCSGSTAVRDNRPTRDSMHIRQRYRTSKNTARRVAWCIRCSACPVCGSPK